MVVNNLGPITAPIVGGSILAFTDWTGVFLVLACIGMVLCLISAWKLEETLPKENRLPSNVSEILTNFGSLLKDRQFTGYALTQGFIIAGIFAYVSGTPFVYQNIYGVSPQVFSLLFGMNGIALMVGSHLVGRYTDVVSEKTLLKIGLFVSTLSGVVLLTVLIVKAPLPAVVVPIFFLVSSLGVVSTTSFSLAMETQGHIAGSASALLGLLPFMLGSLAAPLVGIAGEHTAVPMGIVIFSASFLALISYYGLVRKASLAVQVPR